MTHWMPNNTLVLLDSATCTDELHKNIANTFAGTVIRSPEAWSASAPSARAFAACYVFGNVGTSCEVLGLDPARVFAVASASTNYDPDVTEMVQLGQVPLRVPGIGVLYPAYFLPGDQHYQRLVTSHALQSLTESSKPGESYRRGIYITRVTASEWGKEFKLLRCSTNLAGPTDNRREVDDEIIGAVNELRHRNFPDSAVLDHVLAQEYGNKVMDTGKSKKAAISAHSDKTEDMPVNGTMAFVTFYDWGGFAGTHCTPSCNDNPLHAFDQLYKGTTSVYTRLCWTRKTDVAVGDDEDDEDDAELPKSVEVTLCAGSVLLVPLSTNRLYRHETKPSLLPADMIPTRIGYVIRSSKTRAVFMSDAVMIEAYTGVRDSYGTHILACTDDDREELRALYLMENTTSRRVPYGFIPYSMNEGDYLPPLL